MYYETNNTIQNVEWVTFTFDFRSLHTSCVSLWKSATPIKFNKKHGNSETKLKIEHGKYLKEV